MAEDSPFDHIQAQAPALSYGPTLPGPIKARRGDPVYIEGVLPVGGYDEVFTSDAPLRVRIWRDEEGMVRFRIGRWDDPLDLTQEQP